MIGDNKTLNHLIPEKQQQEIEKLWKAHGMKGRAPQSYHKKLMRLEAAGVDISSIAPTHWGKPLPDWQISIANGEGMEEARRDWTNERISNSLLKADMAAGAEGAAAAKLDKSRAIIKAYKLEHNLGDKVKPLARTIAAEISKREGLSTRDEQNLTRRLKRTGDVT